MDYERNSVLATSSIYGIDILEDNVLECRKRLYDVFEENYIRIFKESAKDECKKAVKYILERNVIWGDALTLKTVDQNPQLIVFSEWSLFNGSMFKRRDFTFRELVDHAAMEELPLFSDLGENVFIPSPEKEYPPIHFLKTVDAEQ